MGRTPPQSSGDYYGERGIKRSSSRLCIGLKAYSDTQPVKRGKVSSTIGWKVYNSHQPDSASPGGRDTPANDTQETTAIPGGGRKENRE